MKKIIIAIIGIVIIDNAVFSQNVLKDYAEGFCVTFENDTIWGYIKKNSLPEHCSIIEFKKDSLSKVYEYTSLVVKSYGFEDHVFVTRRIGSSDSNPLAFVIPYIQDELSLFSRWVFEFKNTNQGKIKIAKEIRYLEIPGKPTLRINDKKFNKQVSRYVSLNKELSLKVLKEEIVILDSIVIAYNLWNKNGRTYNLSKEDLKEIKGKLNLLTDPKFSMNLSMGVVNNFIILESNLGELVSVDQSFSPDLGFGFQYSIFDEMILGFGARYWEAVINPSYYINFKGEMNDMTQIYVKEKSKLCNTSFYLHLYYNRKKMFFGGGVNVGFDSKYYTKIDYYFNDSDLLFSENDSKSFLSSNFYNQSHIDLIIGLKLNTKTSFSFRPFARFSIPFTSLYQTNMNSYSLSGMKAYPFTFGVIIDCSLVK